MKNNIYNVNVSYFEEIWLNRHGGRIPNDVMEDEEGKYVLMGSGKGYEKKVYLPIFSDSMFNKKWDFL